MKRSTPRHKHASETEGGVLQNIDQASNGKWGRKVRGLQRRDKKTDWGERDEDATVDACTRKDY